MADIDTLELTGEQIAVVNHGRGPLLVNGGPGSGKTRVIVERVARLIESGAAKPEQIFCMTFTKKATGEMAQRLKKMRDERQRKSGNDNSLKGHHRGTSGYNPLPWNGHTERKLPYHRHNGRHQDIRQPVQDGMVFQKCRQDGHQSGHIEDESGRMHQGAERHPAGKGKDVVGCRTLAKR